jgi:hypothetical protein
MPLLDQVATLLGRTIVILRFEDLGPSLELALRHARTIFACSVANKEVCVRLLNQLSIKPQSLWLSDSSTKATLKVFARTIAETPLPASDKQLSEIHWYAIAGLNKFITSKSSFSTRCRCCWCCSAVSSLPLSGASHSLHPGSAPRWQDSTGGGRWCRSHQRGAVL